MSIRSNCALLVMLTVAAVIGFAACAQARATAPHLLTPLEQGQPEVNGQLMSAFFLRMAAEGNGFLVQWHSGSGANSLPTGTYWMSQQITASDAVEHDEFGYAVALTGDTAVIGPTTKSVGKSYAQGVAYIFRGSSPNRVG